MSNILVIKTAYDEELKEISHVTSIESFLAIRKRTLEYKAVAPPKISPTDLKFSLDDISKTLFYDAVQKSDLKINGTKFIYTLNFIK